MSGSRLSLALELLQAGTKHADLVLLHGEFVTEVGNLCVEGVEFIVLDTLGEEVVDPLEEVAEDVHVVGESIEGAVVETAQHGHSLWLRGHVLEVVGSLKAVPVLLDAAVLAGKDATNEFLIVEIGRAHV